LKYPPTRTLSGDERQLLWKFRFSLMSEKRALTKFLRCVEWSDVQVSVQLLLVDLFSWFLLFMLHKLPVLAGSKASNSTDVQMGNDRCM